MAPRIAEESLEGRRESSQSNILLFISLYFWSVINVLWTGHKRSKKANNGGNVASNLITILPKMSIERERERERGKKEAGQPQIFEINRNQSL